MSSDGGVIVVKGDNQLLATTTEPETASNKSSTKNEEPAEELPATKEAGMGGESGEIVSDEKNAVTSAEKVTSDETVQNEAENACETKGLLVESEVVEASVENAIDCMAEIEREGLETRDVEAGDDAKSDHAVASATAPVSSITFHDLGYEVTQRKCFKRLPNKIILDSVSGEMKTGVNAIMGPTGSGKTTLLDLLADRKDRTGRSGKVLINGQKRRANYKTLVGYVVQDDVVMGTLSVRENLDFSAALRLPGHMTRAQRKERVERVIETLGLYRCADTKVGTEFFRGVSGGERKRTNIGMELIIEPQVLFLDEPTTGLDAHTAVSVVSLLKNLSVNEKRVIVLSIHQPRYSIFKLFDSLTLLSQGSTVYHGPAHLALAYFDKLGFRCEEHENPADFFLDTIIHYEKQLHQSSQETVLFSKAIIAGDEEAEDGVIVSSESGEKTVRLVESYRKSEEYGELRERIDPVLQNVVEEKRKEPLGRQVARMMFTRELYATSFLWQLLIVTMRSVKNLLRSPQLSVFQLIFTSVLGIIIGIIYWQLDTDPNSFTDRIGVFFFIATNQSFGSLGAIQLFIQQKALFIHENASGYYRVSAFFISKITTDLIPLRFFPNLIFTIIVYFMIGFQVQTDKFFIFWLILTLVNVCAVSIAFFISAGVRNGEIANLLIILPFIFSLLFGGLLISLDSLPVWVAWLSHFSFIKYGVEGFAINEMNGLRFQGPCQVEQVFDVMQEGCIAITSFTPPDNCTYLLVAIYLLPLCFHKLHHQRPVFKLLNSKLLIIMLVTVTIGWTDCAFDGLAQLGQLGYGNTVSVLWWDVFALVLYSSIFLVLAYVVLRLIKKEK